MTYPAFLSLIFLLVLDMASVNSMTGPGPGDGLQGNKITPFSESLLHMEKKLHPKFFSSYGAKMSKEYVPVYETNYPTSDMKRFMPFHPLARFRGLTSGDQITGGVLGNPFYAPDLDSYRSSTYLTPGHPVVNEHHSNMNTHDAEDDYEEERQVDHHPTEYDEPRKMSAGDILAYLNAVSSRQPARGERAKIFRFGIK